MYLLITDQNFSPFLLISCSLIRKFILGFSYVRASFQTGVHNKKKLDMHRTRITALREADFFIFKIFIAIKFKG